MGRKPCCDKVGLKSGPWTIEEDHKLMSFVLSHGIHCWRTVPKLAGLLRCGKSCRLRWINYLRPDLKRGGFTEAEEDQIIQLHETLGNRWSKIASHFPGRTDNEIKNHWNTRIKKRLKEVSNAETAAAAAEAAKEVSNVENRDEEGCEDVSNKLAQNDKTSELGNVNDLLSNYEIFNGRLEVIEHWLNEESIELDEQSSLLASLQGSLNASLSEISPRQLETPYSGVHEWFDEMESFFAFNHHPDHLS